MKHRADMQRNPASFRDPSGYVFEKNGTIYRCVSPAYAEHYERLMSLGLYEALVKGEMLVSHTEVTARDIGYADPAYKVLKPQQIPFISYPYEWSFFQLKRAALLTLEIQRISLDHGMTLKDATPTNVQFVGSHPIFIDTLSFERYEDGAPWVAYKQFCEMFLAPLLLAACRYETLLRLQSVHHRGLDLKVVSELLPWTTYLRPSILMHVHIHAWLQQKYSGTGPGTHERKGVSRMGKTALYGLIDSLAGLVTRLTPRSERTEWRDYYDDTMYSSEAFDLKHSLVQRIVRAEKPGIVWDLGANTGEFSAVAAESGASVVAFDIDHAAIGALYQSSSSNDERNILPLVMDLANPSPALGWAHSEHRSLMQRGPADLVLALALIHHLAITNNVPFDHIARFMAGIAKQLVIEYVPKDDVNVHRLLSSRKDIFDAYTQNDFEDAFKRHFSIVAVHAVGDSGRTLYHMKLKDGDAK